GTVTAGDGLVIDCGIVHQHADQLRALFRLVHEYTAAGFVLLRFDTVAQYLQQSVGSLFKRHDVAAPVVDITLNIGVVTAQPVLEGRYIEGAGTTGNGVSVVQAVEQVVVTQLIGSKMRRDALQGAAEIIEMIKPVPDLCRFG